MTRSFFTKNNSVKQNKAESNNTEENVSNKIKVDNKAKRNKKEICQRGNIKVIQLKIEDKKDV